jgi:hypothetical protein
MNFDAVPAVSGVASATTQVTQAVSDLNTALAANGVPYNFTINGSNSGPQVFYEVNTDAGVGSAEVTELPTPGISTVGTIALNLNQTGSNGTPFFSTSGVTASSPHGYDTVFYKMAMHELLHTMGLANTTPTVPLTPNIMGGFTSTNDANNDLGDASNVSNLLTPCIFSQFKYALSAIHKPVGFNDGGGESRGDPVPDLPFHQGGGGGGGDNYSCYSYAWDEWDEGNLTFWMYTGTICY